MFALGCCLGLFGALPRRWQVNPLRVTAVVVVLALLMSAPAKEAVGLGVGPALKLKAG